MTDGDRGALMRHAIKNNLYMFKYVLQNCPLQVVLGLVSVVLKSGVSLLDILLLKYILDSFNDLAQMSRAVLLICVFFLVSVLAGAFSTIISTYFTPINSQKLHRAMQLTMFKKALTVDYALYDDPEFYNNYTIAIAQADVRAFEVLNSILDFVGAVFTIASLLLFVGVISPVLIGFVALSVIITIAVKMKDMHVSHDYAIAMAQGQRELSYYQRIFYLKQYAAELRQYCGTKEIINTKYNATLEKLVDVIKKYTPMVFKYQVGATLQVDLLRMVTMVYLAYGIFRKEISVGDFVALTSACTGLFTALLDVLSISYQVYNHSLYIDNFREFMDSPDEQLLKKDEPLCCIDEMKCQYLMSLEKVSFSYPKAQSPSLKNITLDIKSGEKIAVVGANGSGKSTLLKILMRLYVPDSGDLLIEGRDAREIDIEEYRKAVGIVHQDFQVFSFTVAENILMRPILNEKEDAEVIYNALGEVGLLNKIQSLKNGIYTIVTKEFDADGACFSGGELQKLALARVLAQGSRILLLDEPFSALDQGAGNELQNFVFHLDRNYTAVIVTHKLSGLENADRIIVLDNSEIAEEGSHYELMERGGIYARMYNYNARCV